MTRTNQTLVQKTGAQKTGAQKTGAKKPVNRDARRFVKHHAMAALYRLYPFAPTLERPVFIVGCGRSGTTILGKLLGEHPQVVYLNEARHIWVYQRETDIWSKRAAREQQGRLRLAAEDLEATKARQMRRAFEVELRLRRGQYLVEKTPSNSFRIPFLQQLYPQARFIHLLRHGIEVAQSIATSAAKGGWYGHQDYKWQLLVKEAHTRGEGELVGLCHDPVQRGLLEWRLSVLTAKDALQGVPAAQQLELRYESLLKDPQAVCERLETFIGLPPSEAMRRFAAEKIKPARPARLLELSLEGQRLAAQPLAAFGYTFTPTALSAAIATGTTSAGTTPVPLGRD